MQLLQRQRTRLTDSNIHIPTVSLAMSHPASEVDGNGVSIELSPSGESVAERANAKLLNRFYEPLHLLGVLNADRGPGEVDLPSSPQSRGFRVTLRRSLDDLAWLCDNKHGGEAVSAVAAQDLPEGVKFWLVSKYEASYRHLQWVLSELSTARDSNDEEVQVKLQRIAERSIAFSRDKVKRYKKGLKLALTKAKATQPDQGSISARGWISRG